MVFGMRCISSPLSVSASLFVCFLVALCVSKKKLLNKPIFYDSECYYHLYLSKLDVWLFPVIFFMTFQVVLILLLEFFFIFIKV
jgi:hypothetical protein